MPPHDRHEPAAAAHLAAADQDQPPPADGVHEVCNHPATVDVMPHPQTDDLAVLVLGQGSLSASLIVTWSTLETIQQALGRALAQHQHRLAPASPRIVLAGS